MPSRQTSREVLQLRADLWRIPFALCITTLVFFFVTIQIDRAAARLADQSDDQKLRQALSDQAEAVWEAVSVTALVKADRADIEVAYRRARVALGDTL